MASEEKRAWVVLLVTLLSYAVYLVVVLGRARGETSLPDVAYASALLWTVGGAALAGTLGSVLAAAGSSRSEGQRDERDLKIKLFGEYIGNSLFVLGGGATLIMSMAELDHFWISNAIYLAFVLSVAIGSVVKIVGYRRGFQQW